jgi:hypothetical protein
MRAKKTNSEAFVSGVASTADFFGITYILQADHYLQRSDIEAIRGDWIAVGEDIKLAMEKNGTSPRPAGR